MDTTREAIHQYFSKLRLAPEIADIYLALHDHGPQTLSSLARASGVERTRIYRLLGDLADSNLIESSADYQRGLLQAAPIANLHILINQKAQEVASLKEELGLIEQTLGRNTLSTPAHQIQTYQGEAAIRHLLWGILDATTPVFSYQFKNLAEPFGQTYWSHWYAEAAKRKLQLQHLVSDEYIASLKENKLKLSSIHSEKYNYVPRHLLPITHTVFIYNDMVVYLNWDRGNVSGIRIRNNQIAETQRVQAHTIWQQTKPLSDQN